MIFHLGPHDYTAPTSSFQEHKKSNRPDRFFVQFVRFAGRKSRRRRELCIQLCFLPIIVRRPVAKEITAAGFVLFNKLMVLAIGLVWPDFHSDSVCGKVGFLFSKFIRINSSCVLLNFSPGYVKKLIDLNKMLLTERFSKTVSSKTQSINAYWIHRKQM